MILESEQLDVTSCYKLLIGSIIPRPIAWVSTESVTGVGNLAPISFFTCVGRKPPRISLSLQPRSDGITLKDTFVNIRDTGQFVVNMATLPQIAALHHSAMEFEPDVDEFEAVGVDREPSALVKPPRIKDAPVAMECNVFQIFSAPDGLHHAVWGEVAAFYVRDDLLINGRVDFGGISPVGRLAAEYTVVDNVFVPPLSEEMLAEQAARRMRRLDGQDAYYSPVGGPTWSPSGAVVEP